MTAVSTPTGGVKRPRLHAEIADLARISQPAGRGVTREVFTSLYSQACEFTAELMREAGLAVHSDPFGNLWGTWAGTDPSLPAVLTGSHVDTTLDAGASDGVLGVLGAIAAVGELRAAGARPRRSIQVIAFAGEEPRFGSGCIGSRALMGQIARSDLDRMVDREGISIAQAMCDVGLDPDRVAEVRLDPRRYHALVELHIEQGRVLEAAGMPIGVVRRIAAPHDVRVTLHGDPGHAGATPMRLRRDAFAGAAEAAVLLERMALESPSDTLVATAGKVTVAPGAINVVPGEVTLEIDVRDCELEPREQLLAGFLAELDRLAQRRGLTVTVEQITEDSPAPCADLVVDAVTTGAAALGIPAMPMISGAYHDAMILGPEIPMGMIFVPSRDGLSHHPDEYTSPAELDLGVDVLAETLARLAA
jgi:hydantoinase/carbamoylase family amidase